jgi:hypothetical protein
MPFSESIKLKVKKQADFTCCWCRDRAKRVDVHHIIPEVEYGPDTEDNAAPLCGSCHDIYGGNPDLRKEIRQRRDDWYERCSWKPDLASPIGLDVPLLDYTRTLPPSKGIPTEGIQLIDKDHAGKDGPPLLYLSIYFKTTRYFIDYVPDTREKWLYIQADMRPALNLRIHVRALNDRDVLGLMDFLRTNVGGYNLQSPSPQNDESSAGDYFYVWHENGENRLMLSTFTATCAGVSIHARFSEIAGLAFADYLERSGFAALGDTQPRHAD